jgi:sugar phosphate isomerase/epimerase
MLSITSDYFQSEGDPLPYLKRIANAGFTHIHWCHQWCTDYMYPDDEIDQIGSWLKSYGLSLLNLHATHGKDKYWVAYDETRRRAGVELVKNRILMTARLGGDVTIVHIPTMEPKEALQARMVQIRKSLDVLESIARNNGIRLAAENMDRDDFEVLETILGEYDPGYLGLCYDSGHANLGEPGLEHLKRLKNRLIAIHLHDNDGLSDQHNIPFTGMVDWPGLIKVIASSSYSQCINLEVGMRKAGYTGEVKFLKQSHLAGEKLTAMLHTWREK